MRAAIFVEQRQDLSLEDVTALEPSPRDVVVHVHASGVCHSDQMVIDRMPGGRPMILGHEACGVELIETGRVDLGGMVTKHFSLEEVNQALAAMRDGEVVRGVLMGS